MANLNETSTFDEGVYQLELTDPVIGGPNGKSNQPLKNLANRTRYLKDVLDALLAGAPADLNTLAEIATALGLKAPIASPTFTGNPAAPTPAQFDNDTSLATTEFLKRQGVQYSGVYATNGALTGVVAHVGGVVYAYGASGPSYSFPDTAANSIPIGVAIKIWNMSTVSMTIVRQGSNVMQAPDGGATFTSFSLPPGSSIEAVHVGPGTWELQGTGVLKYSANFGASLASNGYQKLPSGLIIQWGQVVLTIPSTQTVTFPISFPTDCTSVVANDSNGNATSSTYWSINRGTASFNIKTTGTASGGAAYFNWIAIGY